MNVNKNSSLLAKSAIKEDIAFLNKNDDGVLLLLDKPKENTKILKEIGFDNYLSKVEGEAHVKNSKTVIAQLFGKPAYLGSEIKKLCNEYDLVISKVINYDGAPFKDLPEIIQAFIDDNSSDVVIPAKTKETRIYYYGEPLDKPSEYKFYDLDIEKNYKIEEKIVSEEKTVIKSKIKTGYANWFIMAPRESFNGNKKNTCCTLFYRDNDDSRDISEKDVFTEVYSWGGAYSDIRKYNYFLKNINWEKERDKSEIRYIHTNEASSQNVSLIISIIVLFITSLFYKFTFIFPLIVQLTVLLLLYLAIKKPNSEYLKLWKM